MQRVRSRDTKPERIVRSLLHRQGFRFSLHKKKLPGRPDIVLAKHRTAIFVHGCFWHRHKGCADATIPKTRTKFWVNKFAENTQRDKKNKADLRAKDWKVLIVWECETYKPDSLVRRLIKQIKSSN